MRGSLGCRIAALLRFTLHPASPGDHQSIGSGQYQYLTVMPWLFVGITNRNQTTEGERR